MICYFDASALVKRYVEEPESDAVESLLQENVVATSRFTHVEILSAIARRFRDGDVSASDYRHVVSSLRHDFGRLVAVELTDEVIDESERLLSRHRLRAGDAVQVASCLVLQARAETPVTFVAYDDRCNEAAAVEALHCLQA